MVFESVSVQVELIGYCLSLMLEAGGGERGILQTKLGVFIPKSGWSSKKLTCDAQ